MKEKKLEIGIIGGSENREIKIVEYDDRWPLKFAQHVKIIEEAVGDVAIGIEHIGSTAVPGLAAKPIIDILLIVKDSSDEGKYLDQMLSAGYQLRVREPDFHEHRMFRTQNRDVHVHVFSEGSSEIDRYLIFRNRLRAIPSERRDYESVKRKLAAGEWEDMNEYATAKTEIVERIISAGIKSKQLP